QEFDDLVQRATEREPAARFRDAAEMGTALEAVAARLRLPRFRVPAPRNSAQHRSMAVPPPPPPPEPPTGRMPQGGPGADGGPDDATTALRAPGDAAGVDAASDSTAVLPGAAAAAAGAGAAAAGTG